MHLGPTWSQFGGNFHENYGRQWPESEKWTPRVAYRRRMAHAMHIISPCVRPKRAHKQNIRISCTYLRGQDSHEGIRETEKGARNGGGTG